MGVRNKAQPVAPAVRAVQSVTIPDSSMLLLLNLIMHILIACTTGIFDQIAEIPVAFLTA
jgi:hypothetical protein